MEHLGGKIVKDGARRDGWSSIPACTSSLASKGRTPTCRRTTRPGEAVITNGRGNPVWLPLKRGGHEGPPLRSRSLSAFRNRYGYSTEQVTTDFLIIGGGVAGLRAGGRARAEREMSSSSRKDAPLGEQHGICPGRRLPWPYPTRTRSRSTSTTPSRPGTASVSGRRSARWSRKGPCASGSSSAGGAEFDQEGSRLAFHPGGSAQQRRILHAQGDHRP